MLRQGQLTEEKVGEDTCYLKKKKKKERKNMMMLNAMFCFETMVSV